MPRKKRNSIRQCGDEPNSCTSPATTGSSEDSDLIACTLSILADQDAIVSIQEQHRFVEYISESIRRKKAVRIRWMKQWCAEDDIISLIQSARDSGDLDEAVWRSFLAAHFGRSSANSKTENQVESAAMFLFAFGDEVKWTWNVVANDPQALRQWINQNASNLRTLSFGNHRKYESKKPKIVWQVMSSFLDLADEYGGPAALILINNTVSDPGERFDVLYKRLRPLFRFNRTGRFDFLELLIDLNLFEGEPNSCYLPGATGPKRGAQLLWGELPPRRLDDLAIELFSNLGVSAQTIEDALCNWQKEL